MNGRKIFIDGGALDGCSIRKFRNEYDKEKEYEIYSFEANPYFNRFHENKDYKYQNVAMWDKDSKEHFNAWNHYTFLRFD